MRIFVKTKPGARRAAVEKIDETHFVISVKEKPQGNEANFAVMEALNRHFHCPLSAVRLVAGRTSTNKVFVIGGLIFLK